MTLVSAVVNLILRPGKPLFAVLRNLKQKVAATAFPPI